MFNLKGHWMVHGQGRMLIQYSNHQRLLQWEMTCRQAFWIDQSSCYAYTLSHTLSLFHTCPYVQPQTFRYTHSNWNLLHKLLLSHSQWKSVRKPHCFDRRHTRSRRRVCQFFNHLAADDLWKEWPCHDKVSELCTFNYRSEGSTYIRMQHPSQVLLIALR